MKRIFLWTLILSFAACLPAAAQTTTTANINGTVTDATGSVIAGATITATNINTNENTTTTTDGAGVYNMRFLKIGTYKLTFEAKGFGTQVTRPFVLEVDQSALRNAKMALAGTTAEVTVQAELAPLLHTENATQSTVLDANAIANIPLYGRNIQDLTQYQPGAISTQPDNVMNEISVNGSRTQGNNYTLDGMEMNQNLDYGTAYNPNPDSIEQIQMLAAVPSAEYGNAEGGSFIEVLKSGTNQFHGNAFFNLQNYLLDANSWGNKHSIPNTPRSPYTSDQFGGTIGGPIIRDKLFFFADYQGYRYHTTSSGFTTVPTYAERGCPGGQIGQPCSGGTMADFSELLDPNVMCNEPGNGCTSGAGANRLIQLYDPFNNFAPYAGNKNVPINNPVAKYLFAHPELLPLPDTPFGINDSVGYNNKSIVQHNFTHSNQYDVKVDYKLSSNDNLSGRYSHFNSVGYQTPSLPIFFNSETPNPVNNGILDEVHTFSPSIVNDFRAGYSRFQSLGAALIDSTGAFGLNGNSLLGIGSAGGAIKQEFAGYSQLGQDPSTNGSPHLINKTNDGNESLGGNANGGTNITLNTFQYSDLLTYLRGRHTLKIGFQLSRYQQNNFYPGNDGSLGGLYGTGVFTGNIINNASDPRYPTTAMALGQNVRGYSFADLILDRISYTSVGGVSGPVGMRQYRGGYFVQDDWKMKPNLTVNVGLRYEYNTQISEVHNKYVALDPATQMAVIAGTPQAEAYCHGCSTTLVHPFYGGVLPRIGFSYAYTPRIVIRGGYSASTFMEGTGANLRMTTNPPFQSAFESNAIAPTAGGTSGSAFTVEQGFNHVAAGAPAAGGVFNVWDPHTRPGYIGTYTLGTEYQINNTSSISLAYVGKQGQHLVTAGAGNQLHKPCTDPSFVDPVTNPLGINTSPGQTNSGPCLSSDPAPFQGVAGLGYYGSVRYTASNAYESDNSLQVVLRQRQWHGLQYTFNFTWGHAMTNSTGFYQGDAYAQNIYNNHSEYGPMYTDARLAANWNMIYALPLGRGRMFGGNMNRVVDELVGGWNMAMTGIEQSGLPLYVNGAYDNSQTNGAGTAYPNQYRRLKIVNRSVQHWYGTDPSTQWCGLNTDQSAQDNGVCAYGQPGLGTFGNAAPMTLRGTPYQLYNAAVVKDFTVWREHKVNFRADAKNVFNMSVLGNPNTDPTSGSFGNINSVKSPNRQLQLTVSYHF